MAVELDRIRAICWRDGALELLDQRELPRAERRLRLTSAGAVARAITDMVVRGAPAIGITAAYGVVLAARARHAHRPESWRSALEQDIATLAAARPTAVNLSWSLRRMAEAARGAEGDPVGPLLAAAEAIHRSDIEANRRMGELGAAWLSGRGSVLTHCNTGSLATGGYGTALGVIRSGYRTGRVDRVYAGETRPWLQGSRLTAWELLQEGVPTSLLADGAAADLMRAGKVGWVIVGADRVAANGDVANKIGTYGLAMAARHHGVGFMVVAPTSTIDLDTADGASIGIECRGRAELLAAAGYGDDPAGLDVWNPVFDVTPAALVDVLVTERGALASPSEAEIRRLLGA